MRKEFNVRCENLNKVLRVPMNTSLRNIMDTYLPKEERDNYISAFVNNESKNMSYLVHNDISLKFITYNDVEGSRVYIRTLLMMLMTVVKDKFPQYKLITHFSVGRGMFFTLQGEDKDDDFSSELKREISELIDENLSIVTDKFFMEDARDIFVREGLDSQLDLIQGRKRLYYEINTLKSHSGYFYGTIADKTGVIREFNIVKAVSGYILMVPIAESKIPTYSIDASKLKMYNIFTKCKIWQELIGIPDVGSLNNAVYDGRADEFVKICEAKQDKIISKLASEVSHNCLEDTRLILISGPSSSGKTTFSRKLNIHLRTYGIKPLVISMDDYFVERENTPLDENGEKDYEAVEAVDVELFQKHIQMLLDGEEVSMPTYNFIAGKREFNGNFLVMKEKSVIIVEGIHALNPYITSKIDRKLIYKIYVSALTSMSMDDTMYLSTTDNRLLRRIVRDAKYRNRSCEETLKWWGGVRRGEEKYIFPFQNEADGMFNSALPYEMNVLKSLAEPLLLEVPNTVEECVESTRLLNILSYLAPIDLDIVPPSSLLREFIGGSSYR